MAAADKDLMFGVFLPLGSGGWIISAWGAGSISRARAVVAVISGEVSKGRGKERTMACMRLSFNTAHGNRSLTECEKHILTSC